MSKKEWTASVFMNGGSQAIRLPREFRVSGDRVRIRREGSAIVIEPLEKSAWPEGFWERIDRLPLPDDFEAPDALPPTSHRDDVLTDL